MLSFFLNQVFLSQNFFRTTKKLSLLSKSKMLPVLSRQCPKEAVPVHNNCRHPKWLSAIVSSEFLVALSCLWIFTFHICHTSSGEKTHDIIKLGIFTLKTHTSSQSGPKNMNVYCPYPNEFTFLKEDQKLPNHSVMPIFKPCLN